MNSAPWDIIENFDDMDDIVSAWMLLFTKILGKHAQVCKDPESKTKNTIQNGWHQKYLTWLKIVTNKNENMDAYRILRD